MWYNNYNIVPKVSKYIVWNRLFAYCSLLERSLTGWERGILYKIPIPTFGTLLESLTSWHIYYNTIFLKYSKLWIKGFYRKKKKT